MKCSDLSSSSDHWFPFMKEHQLGSSRWIRNPGGSITPQQLGQEDISKGLCISFCSVKSNWEIVPEQGDKPVRSEIGFPVLSDQFFLHLCKEPVFCWIMMSL